MRVAQVMAGAPAGGAELFFERLSLALRSAGETVLPLIRHDSARAARLRAGGLEPMEFRFGAIDMLTGRRLMTALRRFAPRVTIAWMNRAARFVPAGDWVLIGRLGGFYDLRHYRHCDHLVGNTRGLVHWIIGQGWPAPRVHHLPNFAADLAGAVPVQRSALGVPESSRLVLALGRLHPNKGFDVLVRALPRLPGVHAVIAGDGSERQSLTELARAEGVAERLHLPGWRDDTGALLATADALICPSRIEPLGNVVIEAWAARRPVIAAESDGPRELISSGADGVLVAIDDAAGLAQAITGVLEDPRRAATLAEAGRARYEAAFAEAPVVAQWRRFLTSVEKP